MRLLATAAALVCVLVLVPAAAARAVVREGAGRPVPERSHPRPAFDFEVTPRTPAVNASSGRVLSRPLRTKRHFNLLGMRWRGGARAAVRVRRPGGRWSRWQRLEAHTDHGPDPGAEATHATRRGVASDPLWVGSADAVQYRLSRRASGLRLHFVNVASRLRTRAGAAQTTQPAIVSRAQWGASQCQPRGAPLYGAVKAVHVHHTVSLNDYSPQEAPAMVLAVCRYHRNSNGWNDIGYNALVDKYGVLYEGRAGGLDQAVVGAQAQGFNSETAGIASIADHTTVGATPETLSALSAYISWKLGVHGQPLSGSVTLTSAGGSATRYSAGRRVTVPRVLGHRDTGLTACPGELLYAQLDQLRAMVATGVAGVPTTATRLSATLADYDVDYGTVVPLSGLLAGPDGSPLAGEPIEVQVNADGRWVRSKRLGTALDGTFATELKPRKRMYVRLRFSGHAQLRRATSTRLLLRLHPAVTLRRPARRATRGARVTVSGTVAPRKRVVYVVLQQQVKGRYRKVGSKGVRAKRGRFASWFAPRSRGLYRYAVVVKSDEDTDRGSTGWRTLRVN